MATQTITPAVVSSQNLRRVLSAGSGPICETEKPWLDEWKRQGYEVLRLDIEPKNEPDFVASMTDMGDVGTYDVVYC